jgi:hypothetical protein
LSEPGITSDKISCWSRCFVRTWHHFRQNLMLESTFCPNTASLQTKPHAGDDISSELGFTSDKTPSLRHCFVRTWHHFRQNLMLETLFCPNLASLQTKPHAGDFVLSKPGITSDKTPSLRHCFVRTWHHFRQNLMLEKMFCPNMASLQTKSHA